MPQNKIFDKQLIFYILIAYLFSLVSRLPLYWLAKDHPDFFFHSQIISIWTPDASLYANVAKKLLNGLHLPFDSERTPGFLIYWITKLFHLKLDNVVFFLPAFLSSLLIIPLILISKKLGVLKVGFLSALAASIGMNYYFRTHLGYTDTDMLIYFFFFTIIYTFISFLKSKNILYALLGAISIALFHQWYHSSKPLTASLLLFYIFYILLFERKNQTVYFALVLLLIPFIKLSLFYQVGLIVLLAPITSLFSKKVSVPPKLLFIIVTLFLIGFSFYASKNHFFNRAFYYIEKKDRFTLEDKTKKQINIQATLKTVAESKGITFDQLITYSSGSMLIFIIGTLGLALLIFKNRYAFFLLLPYIIGLFSLKTGVRFSTFAVPVIAFGTIYLFYEISLRFGKKRYIKAAIFYIPSLSIISYYLYILNTYNHLLSPFFKSGQLQSITRYLNNKDQGYILTWWDYGWPLEYYTNKNTIIDNGTFYIDTYLIAKSLFSTNLLFVANLDRYAVEWKNRRGGGVIFPFLLKQYSLQELFKKMSQDKLKPPQKKNSIYYYFDDRILSKLPVIESFSYIQGEKKRGLIWTTPLLMVDHSKRIVVAKKVKLNYGRGTIQSNNQKIPIGTLIVHNGKRIINYIQYRKNPYTIIIYKNRYMIGIYNYLNSFFIRAFFLNNLDKNLFKTVTYNEHCKIFQLVGR